MCTASEVILTVDIPDLQETLDLFDGHLHLLFLITIFECCLLSDYSTVCLSTLESYPGKPRAISMDCKLCPMTAVY